MRGPPPKPAATRQRRNKASTAAVLDGTRKIRAPKLPPLKGGATYHAQTVAWWRDVWRSPMAAEYMQADIHGLFRLAVLVDAFWERPSVALETQIARSAANYGLTPIDRRRLQWTVRKAEDGKRTAPPATGAVDDPRSVLRVV